MGAPAHGLRRGAKTTSINFCKRSALGLRVWVPVQIDFGLWPEIGNGGAMDFGSRFDKVPCGSSGKNQTKVADAIGGLVGKQRAGCVKPPVSCASESIEFSLPLRASWLTSKEDRWRRISPKFFCPTLLDFLGSWTSALSRPDVRTNATNFPTKASRSWPEVLTLDTRSNDPWMSRDIRPKTSPIAWVFDPARNLLAP